MVPYLPGKYPNPVEQRKHKLEVCNSGWFEVHIFPIDEYSTRPLIVENSHAVALSEPGTGVVFDWENLAPYEM